MSSLLLNRRPDRLNRLRSSLLATSERNSSILAIGIRPPGGGSEMEDEPVLAAVRTAVGEAGGDEGSPLGSVASVVTWRPKQARTVRYECDSRYLQRLQVLCDGARWTPVGCSSVTIRPGGADPEPRGSGFRGAPPAALANRERPQNSNFDTNSGNRISSLSCHSQPEAPRGMARTEALLGCSACHERSAPATMQDRTVSNTAAGKVPPCLGANHSRFTRSRCAARTMTQRTRSQSFPGWRPQGRLGKQSGNNWLCRA